jgi:hypothetical protein
VLCLRWVPLGIVALAAGWFLGDLEQGLLLVAVAYLLSWNRWPDRRRSGNQS